MINKADRQRFVDWTFDRELALTGGLGGPGLAAVQIGHCNQCYDRAIFLRLVACDIASFRRFKVVVPSLRIAGLQTARNGHWSCCMADPQADKQRRQR
jgi:hypothetical protein